MVRAANETFQDFMANASPQEKAELLRGLLREQAWVGIREWLRGYFRECSINEKITALMLVKVVYNDREFGDEILRQFDKELQASDLRDNELFSGLLKLLEGLTFLDG